MEGLRTELLVHSEVRTVPCCLCGSEWEEQLVGVALIAGQSILGDLCPRCLNRKPADTAVQMKTLVSELLGSPVEGALPPGAGPERLKYWTAQLRQWSDHLLSLAKLACAVSAELRAAVDKSRQERADNWATLRRTIAESRRLRSRSDVTLDARWEPQGGATPGVPWPAGETRGLLLLADRLAVMEQWDTTVEEVVEAERLTFRQRYGWFDDQLLERVVDNRYRDFLAPLA